MIRNVLLELSWKKINTFLQCKRCFYKQYILNKKSPELDPGYFSIHNTVDKSLKHEFDYFRNQQKPHPIMNKFGIDAIPYKSELIYIWRDFAEGISVIDQINGFKLIGVIDDIWINPAKELIVVDYKVNSKHPSNKQPNKWALSNKKQMSFYAYILKMDNYVVSCTGYFMHNIPVVDKQLFNQTLEFQAEIKPCLIDDSWVEPTLVSIRSFFEQPLPEPSYDCNYCKYESEE